MKKFLALLFLSLSCLAGDDYDFKVKVIPLKALDYETVNQFCRPMLSKKGAMAYLKDRRAVLVHDSPKVIKKVQDFIEQADTERKNIRITVDYVGSGSEESSEFGVKSDDWQVRIEDGKVKLPKVDGVTASKKTSKYSSRNKMHLVTVSGMAASLWVGKDVPEAIYIRRYIVQPRVKLRRRGRPVVIDEVDFEMRKVGASLRMRPTLQADGTVLVEIFPEVSYYTKEGKRDVLKVESLSTTVVAMPGHRISVGGAVSKKKGGYTNLFGPDFFKKGAGQDILDMFLSVEVMK